jgi:hypothetical protein
MNGSEISASEQAVLDQVSTDRLMTATEAISQWERLSGTDDEAKAFDWIENQLREYGLDPVRYSHPALGRSTPAATSSCRAASTCIATSPVPRSTPPTK